MGANIGLFTLVFAKKFPTAFYICVEPEQNNFAFLRKNTSTVKNVKYYNGGIWKTSCPLKVTTTELSSGTVGYIVKEVEHDHNDKRNCVSGIDIMSLMKENCIDKIDILKMDIEGSEFPIFFVWKL